VRRIGRLVLVGRRELPSSSPVERVLHDLAMSQARKAEALFRWRWPDEQSRWNEWQVVALTGTSPWDRARFCVYEGFGVTPFPVLTGGVDYRPTVDTADLFEASRVDPPLLHRSWKLFGPGDVDGGNHGRQAGFIERLKTLGRQLDRRQLTEHPFSATQRSWERLLAMRGLSINPKNLRLETA
jgi:hypothetical protein